MPAINQNISGQQYVIRVTAGESVAGAAPNTPNRRLLIIQNTGANQGNLRFDNQAGSTTGADFVFVPGQIEKFSDNECPTDRLNFYSLLGTTFAVYEAFGS